MPEVINDGVRTEPRYTGCKYRIRSLFYPLLSHTNFKTQPFCPGVPQATMSALWSKCFHIVFPHSHALLQVRSDTFSMSAPRTWHSSRDFPCTCLNFRARTGVCLPVWKLWGIAISAKPHVALRVPLSLWNRCCSGGRAVSRGALLHGGSILGGLHPVSGVG